MGSFVKIRWPHILSVILSGALTALSFPKFDLSFLCWISLIPFFFALYDKTPRQSFFLGFLGGIAFNAILIYWIPAVPAHYGNISIGMSLLIYTVFVCYLALFWALFSWCFARNRVSHQVSTSLNYGPPSGGFIMTTPTMSRSILDGPARCCQFDRLGRGESSGKARAARAGYSRPARPFRLRTLYARRSCATEAVSRSHRPL